MNRPLHAVKANKQQDLHRPVDAQVKLEEVLCVQENRVVGQDWCVRWRNRWLQIEKVHAGLNLANKRVRVKQRAGGELIVEHKGQRLDVPGIEPAAHAGQKQKEAGGGTTGNGSRRRTIRGTGNR